MAVGVGGYARLLKELLPPGNAWSLEIGSLISKLLTGYADEYARLDARAAALIEETDPRSALETLPDWETMLGLPDECLLRLPSDLTERRILVSQKAIAIGGQTPAFYFDLMLRLGYAGTITEFAPFRIGNRVGDRLYGVDWAFAWEVRVSVDTEIRAFRVGTSRVGERLRGWGAVDLECILLRAKPAHTVILFVYE